MNIIFNQSDVEQMAASFKNRLSEAVKQIPCGEASLEDIQRWAREQNIDIPELLEAALKKNRDWGKSNGKPLPQMSKPAEIPR